MKESRIFYKKKFQIQPEKQLYTLWFGIFIIISFYIFFGGTEKIDIAKNPRDLKKIPLFTNSFFENSSNHNLWAEFNTLFSLNNWKYISQDYLADKKKCTNHIYTNKEKSKEKIFMLLPDENFPHRTAIASILNNVNGDQLKLSYYILLYDTNETCQGNNYFIKSFLKDWPDSIIIDIIPGEKNKNQLNIAANSGKISSVNWLNIFPFENNRENILLSQILQQINLNIFSTSKYILDNFKNSIGWKYAKLNNKNETSDYFLQNIYRTMVMLEEININKIYANSFWLNDKLYLNKNALLLIKILLILLLFIPLINRLYFYNENILLLHNATIIFQYYIIQVIIFIIFSIFYAYGYFHSIMWALFIPLLFIVDKFLYNITKKYFIINESITGSLLVFTVTSSILAYFNLAIITILLPIYLFNIKFIRVPVFIKISSNLLYILGISLALNNDQSIYYQLISGNDLIQSIQYNKTLFSVYACSLASFLNVITFRENK